MFKDILLPVNMSDPATWERPLEVAIYLARNCGARLHLMTVMPSFDYPMVENFFPVDFEEKAHARLNKEIHAFVAEHIPDDLHAQTIIAVGSIYEQILETAREIKSDLIIMTRKGGPRRHYFMGSNANKVINHAETAVLVLE